MKKISVVFGTRPEAIKLCPLIRYLRMQAEFLVDVCVTAQHREMLDQVLEVFEVVPDTDLNLMRSDQTLASFTSRAIETIDGYMKQAKPDLVMIQGDTTTVLSTALAAFYNRVPVGHVEAGLRTGSRYSPFPEEINRRLASHISEYHFAPTENSRRNLLNEGIADDRIFITGNTVIDALYFAVEKIGGKPPDIPGLPKKITEGALPCTMVLITGHRRENFGEPFKQICQAISTLSDLFPDAEFVYPVHLNPNVRNPVFEILSGRDNVHLIEPLDYLSFVALMNRSTLVLTDSGGIQEEAPSLGKPVLVMRDTTERPEAVAAGTVKLTGADRDAIIESVTTLLTDECAYRSMAHAANPYGDGTACRRIVSAMKDFMCLDWI